MPQTPADPPAPDSPRRSTDIGGWRATAWVVGLLGVAYLLLFNAYWTPGGDSELFLAAGRSIYRGEGFSYNGQPVAMIPPGWSLLLAGLFHISAGIWLLKLATLLMMLGSLVIAHRVLLRFTDPRRAAWCVVLAGLTLPVYTLTFWLHSDALFCLLAWAVLLLGVRLTEGRDGWFGIVSIAFLCGAMATVRWQSPLQWGLLAGVLLPFVLRTGRLVQRRAIVATLVSFAVTIGGFFLVRQVLADRADAAFAPGEIRYEESEPVRFIKIKRSEIVPPSSSSALPISLPLATADAQQVDPLRVLRVYGERILGAGRWPAWALWYPTRFASGLGPLDTVSIAVGWLALAFLILAAVAGLLGKRGQRERLIWSAVLGYIFLHVLVWPNTNARYMVPVLPLIVLGVLRGLDILRPRLGRFAGALLIAFLASLLAINLPMYFIDMAVQRSGSRYYAWYENGAHESLLTAIDHLREIGVGDGDVAVSEYYENLGRVRNSQAGLRSTVLLLDRDVVRVPYARSQVIDEKFAAWAKEAGARYLLFQQPASPWRVWHFRLPPELQATLTGQPTPPETFGWQLWTADNGWSAPLPLSIDYEPVTRIPGMPERQP